MSVVPRTQYTVYNDALLTRDPVPHVQAGLNSQQQKQKQQDDEAQAGADSSSDGSTDVRWGDNGDDSAALMVAEATETAERFAEYVMGHVKQGREGQLQAEGEGKGKGRQWGKGDGGGEAEAEGGGDSAGAPFSAAVRGVHVCRRFANVIALRWVWRGRGSRPCGPPPNAGSTSAGPLLQEAGCFRGRLNGKKLIARVRARTELASLPFLVGIGLHEVVGMAISYTCNRANGARATTAWLKLKGGPHAIPAPLPHIPVCPYPCSPCTPHPAPGSPPTGCAPTCASSCRPTHTASSKPASCAPSSACGARAPSPLMWGPSYATSK